VDPKTRLVADIGHVWSALEAGLGRLTEAELLARHDAAGWTVKDHVVHLARWERSVVALLHGRPRHEGLGIAASVYLAGPLDAINAAIQAQARDLSAAEAMAELRRTHRELLALLAPLSADDLRRPYRAWLPDEPGDGDGPPAIDVIRANTAGHFAEHLGWIEALVARPG
jgi:hypothetical protein